MEQPALFAGSFNSATVPMRSPFRYPGGKTWLVPFLRQWLRSRNPQLSELVEPFAGGGIASLTAAFEGLAGRVTMVELDEQVAAVWEALLWEPGCGEELARRIMTFDLSRVSVQAALEETGDALVDRAFRTILRNRVNRGGIMVPTASLLNAGENNKGLSSRWYPDTLRRRILEIVSTRSRISFIHGDGLQILEQNADRKDAVFFIDPPYTVAAKRLYAHWEIDHDGLFSLAETLTGDFLMTYDNDERVRSLATRHGFESRMVIMKNTHHTETTELLIGRDLSWLDGPDDIEVQTTMLDQEAVEEAGNA